MTNQILRLPYKYSQLIETLSDEDCWKLLKAFLKKNSDNLEWISLTYYNLISIDIWNIEAQVLQWIKNWHKGGVSWKLWWRPKKKHNEEANDNPGGGYDETPKVKDKVIDKDKVKDIVKIEEEKETKVSTSYWNEDINKTLQFLKQTTNRDDWKESVAFQRIYWKHIFNLATKLWKEEFIKRLNVLCNDKFHYQHLGKLEYIYRTIKSMSNTDCDLNSPF